MITSSDDNARVRALTDLQSTLLVEAAAGTGKTALIAGRLTLLLASGCAPFNVAAITYTEAAASELSLRVHRYIDDLLNGTIPKPLRVALPKGLSETQRTHLESARGSLEDLTSSTIHGFCQTLIHGYAVEAIIDPGAQIIDAAQADIAFDAVFDRWFRSRLVLTSPSTDPIVVLSKKDPTHVVSTIRALAQFRRDHRSARTPAADLSGRPDIELVDAIAQFTKWRQNTPAEPATDTLLVSLEALSEFYRESFRSPLDFESLWRLAHPPQVAAMRKDTSDLMCPRTKTAWQKIAGASEGSRLYDEMLERFTHVNTCYRRLLGKVATALVDNLSTQLEEIQQNYNDFKRKAAVLDFDDLIHHARSLVIAREDVRVALGQRYLRLLVDEFQDTDPIQAEILFRIAATDRPARWQDSTLRAGALFMVGDPKQAIYRFRGADIEIYEAARTAIRKRYPENVLHITASFRSTPEILAHVNRCFEAPLNAAGQPGYVPLTSTRGSEPPQARPCAAKLTIQAPFDPSVYDLRDAEASAVANLCAHLIGNRSVTDEDGVQRPLRPADIALLAPTRTDLWRYERALDELHLPYASQAGKNLFGNQEIQDLVSLARTLADQRDTLAFGALMRGPLVGLTEEEMLDITAQLPAPAGEPQQPARLGLFTDPNDVPHPLGRQILTILRDLQHRAASTTPMLLLGDALERLHVRAILSARDIERAARALANVDNFLELARQYDVRGLKQFARDISYDWTHKEPRSEGKVDGAGDAIDIVTIHSSKGLEWPVVFLINTVTNFRSRERFIHRPSDDTLHWVLGDVVPPDLLVALETDEVNAARERERLLYVAFTRARDLLVLSKLPSQGPKSWTDIVDDPCQDLPELDLGVLPLKPVLRPVQRPNEQTAEVFSEQQQTIAANLRSIAWLRPSLDDLDRMPATELLVTEAETGIETPLTVGAGRLRGLLLHKLMEEILTAELADELPALRTRAQELLLQLSSRHNVQKPMPDELAATIRKTLEIPDIAQIRYGLVPELSIFGILPDMSHARVSGRADAIFIEANEPRAVIDWKSDIAPSQADVDLHAAQLNTYMRAAKINRGALVYLSTATVQWLTL